MNNLEFRVPKDEKEFNEYDLFRWRLLRKPIGKTIESLKDAIESEIKDHVRRPDAKKYEEQYDKMRKTPLPENFIV